jgi:hypothetical protein
MLTCPANPQEQAITLIVFGGFQTSMIAWFEGSGSASVLRFAMLCNPVTRS